MKKFWIVLSAACFAVAAFALWQHHMDASFIIAAIGGLAWFLNYRSRLKELIAEPDIPTTQTGESNQSNEK
jgi:hypothetical protein